MIKNSIMMGIISMVASAQGHMDDLGIKVIVSDQSKPDITICCHGYGHSNEIVDVIHSFQVLPGTLVGFNFPDANITDAHDHGKSTFGSFEEIVPLIRLIKHYICDLHKNTVNLYGFSAGGGAVVNALAALTQSRFDERLQAEGITLAHKQEILTILKNGIIILDCPLKSMDEIMAFRGNNPQLELVRQQYARNHMVPLEVLKDLHQMLDLTILVHFQSRDEILGNRDDETFIQRLKEANRGTTYSIIGFDGGHNTYHKTLWDYYRSLTSL